MNQTDNPLDLLIVNSSAKLRLLRERANQKLIRSGSERGSVTIEQVLWAVALIALVGLVVAALTSFVQGEIGKIG